MYLFVFTILIIFLYFTFSTQEHFGSYVFGFPTRIDRPTKNMSYDIRGEAYFPPLLNLPFDNSSIEPNTNY